MTPIPGADIDLVIFDCDGVLVDSEMLSAATLVDCLGECGYETDMGQVHADFLGQGFGTVAADFRRRTGRALPGDFLERWHVELFSRFDAALRPCPGVAETLEAITRPFCLASSSRPERIDRSLTAAGLAHFFQGRKFSAVEVEHGKPAPDLFLHVARSIGVPAARCLVVEDSLPGVAAARAAGMPVVGFSGGSHITPEMVRGLRDAGCVTVIDDMRRLPALFDGAASDAVFDSE